MENKMPEIIWANSENVWSTTSYPRTHTGKKSTRRVSERFEYVRKDRFDALVKALQFYADKLPHCSVVDVTALNKSSQPIEIDKGTIAREALKGE